ncbi:hypothetical protein HYH03_009194 [Edaphochlamys debaryana]|uniref:Exocyst subunit Exo70 family protein n=1 Tax=Edaphochlamys debaryana TaxID=47281 RepID=A0A835Y7Q2_9CHLO|nr:hypothetical protein HYH03_009194 [Edaphochlamys debaryana]|eukprot:KAG2492529.1 hypothetical protein HYH03_009194 [Edaphochlamys debaryana]
MLARTADQLSTAIQLHARLTAEGEGVLKSLQDKLAQLNAKLAPIHERATALTWAEENITRAKASTEELLAHIGTTRKVEPALRLGPGRSDEQLDGFLAAVERLEEALEALEAHLDGGAEEAVTPAYEHAAALYERAMRDCEGDFSGVLAAHSAARLPSAAWLGERAAPENLRESLAHPQLSLLPPEAIARVSRLAEAMLRARHVACLDVYATARSKALDMLLAQVGLDPASLALPPAALAAAAGGGSGGALAAQLMGSSAEQLQRLVQGWAAQLRIMLVGAAAELGLAQEVWQSPYDEVTFSETISRSLRLVLQVGKAVCEGRGAARSPDRVFVLLQMHQSLADLLPYLDDLLSPRERCTGLLNEAHVLGVMIGRAARQLFSDFEEAVGGRLAGGGGGQGGAPGGGGGSGASADTASKLTMLDGTVHPVCATTLSFLKRLFTYPNCLGLLFAPPGAGLGRASLGGFGPGSAGSEAEGAAVAGAASSIMRLLMRLMEFLESKSKAYKSPALAALFLMNNVHYMMWTVEQAAAADKAAARARAQRAAAAAAAAAASPDDPAAAAAAAEAEAAGEAGAPVAGGLGVLGSAWVERHKDIVEAYGAAYHEATWRPLIQQLEAVLVTEADPEPSDPGRFKAWLKSRFGRLVAALDGIVKQQSSWTIPDPKLKAGVRRVIKQDLLPLYGEFWERYTAVEFTSHPDKYLKYPPEQLEHLIDHTLFEGRALPPRGSGERGAGGGGGGGERGLATTSRASTAVPASLRGGRPGSVVSSRR